MHWLDENVGFLLGVFLPFIAFFAFMHWCEILYDKHKRSPRQFPDTVFFYLAALIGGCAGTLTFFIFWQVGDGHFEASISIAYRHVDILLQKVGLNPYWRMLASFVSGAVWVIGAFVSCIQLVQFLKRRKRRRSV